MMIVTESDLRKALERQMENMACLLNHMSVPEQWYNKLIKELKADRRGISDALHALHDTGIEVYDYRPALGQTVSVGGCGGKITEITETHVFVEGYYTYSNGSDNDPGYTEHWRFSYALEDIAKVNVLPRHVWYPKEAGGKPRFSWNFEGVPHNSYA